ncbi:MAG: hypothetical protein AAFR70_09325, partial [Pseudomonadota bacterium]
MLIATLLAWSQVGHAKTVNVYTSDWMSDLNPLREETYAAQWMGQLTAYRLFRRMCISGNEPAMRPECLTDTAQVARDNSLQAQMRSSENAHRCYLPSEPEDEGSFLRSALRNTVDLLMKPDLGVSRYSSNKFRLTRREPYTTLKMLSPPNLGERSRGFMDFPLFKPGQYASSPVDSTKAFSPNVFQPLNEVTFGPFAYATGSSPSKVVLTIRSARDNYLSASEASGSPKAVSKVVVHNLPLISQITSLALSPTAQDPGAVASGAHVLLNLGPAGSRLLSGGERGRNAYQSVFPRGIEGPFYIGFNFKASARALKLFVNREFRELFALSLWETEVMKQKFRGLDRKIVGAGQYFGEWKGQSVFDDYPGPVNRPSSAQALRTRIQSFLGRQKNSMVGLRMRMLLTTEAQRLFDPTELSQLKK